MQTKLPKQSSVKGPADWFTGDVYIDVIASRRPTRGKVNAVHFAPGARTAWHRHAIGQTLYVTEGVGPRPVPRRRRRRHPHPATSSAPRPASGTGTAPRPTTS